VGRRRYRGDRHGRQRSGEEDRQDRPCHPVHRSHRFTPGPTVE
jgi:hypothetical protein